MAYTPSPALSPWGLASGKWQFSGVESGEVEFPSFTVALEAGRTISEHVRVRAHAPPATTVVYMLLNRRPRPVSAKARSVVDEARLPGGRRLSGFRAIAGRDAPCNR